MDKVIELLYCFNRNYVHMEVCVRIYQKLATVASLSGYGQVTEKWCIGFLNDARTNGKERDVKDTLRKRHENLNRGWIKKFVCHKRILIVYEGDRPVDFYPIEHILGLILLCPDKPPVEKVEAEVLFSVAVLRQKHRNEHRRDRIPDADLNPSSKKKKKRKK